MNSVQLNQSYSLRDGSVLFFKIIDELNEHIVSLQIQLDDAKIENQKLNELKNSITANQNEYLSTYIDNKDIEREDTSEVVVANKRNIKCLVDMGFSTQDSENMLKSTNNDLNEAINGLVAVNGTKSSCSHDGGILNHSNNSIGNINRKSTISDDYVFVNPTLTQDIVLPTRFDSTSNSLFDIFNGDCNFNVSNSSSPQVNSITDMNHGVGVSFGSFGNIYQNNEEQSNSNAIGNRNANETKDIRTRNVFSWLSSLTKRTRSRHQHR